MEHLGHLKMDFLGLRNLGIINESNSNKNENEENSSKN